MQLFDILIRKDIINVKKDVNAKRDMFGNITTVKDLVSNRKNANIITNVANINIGHQLLVVIQLVGSPMEIEIVLFFFVLVVFATKVTFVPTKMVKANVFV